MKLIKNITFVLLGVCLATPLQAAYLCVQKHTACSEMGTSEGLVTWGVMCDGTGNGNYIIGAAVCSSNYGANMGEVLGESLRLHDGPTRTAEDNKYCWCKMVTPGSSVWHYPQVPITLSAKTCSQACGRLCALTAKSFDSFRESLFHQMAPE